MTLGSNNANLSPEAAAARRRELKRQIIEILADVAMPYSLRIHKAIKAAHLDIPYTHVCLAMRQITSSREYLEATVEADCRTGLDGEESELTEEHRQFAVKKLKPKHSESVSKPSKPDSGMIASSVQAARSQPAPSQAVAPKQPSRFGKTLSLRKSA